MTTLQFSSSSSVQLPSSTTTTPWLNLQKKRPVFSIIHCVSTRPGGRKSGYGSSSSEAQELVTLVMRNFSDKKPLVSTLDKYVKLVRTEHCFLLFEQLGKTDNWLQCLEVWFFILHFHLWDPLNCVIQYWDDISLIRPHLWDYTGYVVVVLVSSIGRNWLREFDCLVLWNWRMYVSWSSYLDFSTIGNVCI